MFRLRISANCPLAGSVLLMWTAEDGGSGAAVGCDVGAALAEVRGATDADGAMLADGDGELTT